MPNSSEHGSHRSGNTRDMTPDDPLLTTVLNLTRFHREHEKFYAESPLHDAIKLQHASRALTALAERWSSVAPDAEPLPSPFAGAADLNDDRATELLGILFMEGQGEPAEITRLKTDFSTLAEACSSTGEWLATAMETSWGMVEALLEYSALADLLADRHRIISNDWQCASMSTLAARNISRALSILAKVDFTPAALRANLGEVRTAPQYLFSAAEMIDHAADLLTQSVILTRDNERRWRIFHHRVEQMAKR